MQVSCGIDSDAGLDEPSAEELAALLAALGDPVRLRIFSIIAENVEVCSCDLEAPVGKSQPTISHHTAKLAAAGLIVGEKRGRWTWWRIDFERARRASSILGELAQQK
jgi:ArsR family transcriptional regulator, arsenate/arsenite/antimonite-responsive transcriptional repressor